MSTNDHELTINDFLFMTIRGAFVGIRGAGRDFPSVALPQQNDDNLHLLYFFPFRFPFRPYYIYNEMKRKTK